ncbi:MAG: response regulator [Candidatus Rokubacteria bacterium]|nr:response regulator [Candidatus Rokubacteria bacterium]
MSPPSVLVVDDDVGTVETLADILGTRAYRVTPAYSGEEAVARARAARYDAIVMDIRMPGLDGVEALREIRRGAPATRVIMMTAFTRSELIEAAKAATAVAVLPKPLDVDRLLGLLAEITGAPEGLR